ncbi:hypothetical protein [Bradyrhizobium sp. SZCCHNRI3052]|uniref:hypothetical protein n=1 Tax=Bradyrhizobium sp. SZCCHNRI3052 TaxID=3057295 RepID=UPI0029166834|nr:hypothetical protein [Bradyrhizobium sp. SZCCHNRI3052]
MSARESIDWCQRQIENAQEKLSNIGDGARYFVNGEEITGSVAGKATAIVTAMTALIGAYTLFLR